MAGPPAVENYVGIKMSDEMLKILNALASKYYMDRSRLIRKLIREQAEREKGIDVPEVVRYEST